MTDPLAAYKARARPRRNWRKESEREGPARGVGPSCRYVDPLLHAAHALALGDSNCDAALSVLEAASPSPAHGHQGACQQLGWACATEVQTSAARLAG